MLTRDFLINADCRSSFGHIDDQLLLTPQQRKASLAEFLNRLPEGLPVWIFGYGSLMWNPVLDYNDVRPAVLEGWHRAFCIRLIAGRGTECQPGRMLALQSGGRTRGRVFRLSDDNRAEELELLWKREMLTGCYCPRWEAVTLDDGQQIIALVFTINPLHPLFESDNSPSVIAPLIAAAKGPLGTNAQYLYQLVSSLSELGEQDDTLLSLARDVRQLQQQ
ncbi:MULTISPECIES: gamma-glutamylcyclotransferase [Tatumella]|uniref:glutathione-specific gamma-glutamylcyclotransferase n=1 Tax=Tatumella punctata TaxID=399969 RepID=A0ABW1VR67_9GAMM|nr:gamma-glutamylcyclotransferase [Tatumella sp. JGM16]MBS0876026.1 gamma-glutamylcyclotransferase [Tatumella sp. JGM82]MBS0890500.1 gamma-glutamylcyclotransferase [Tatumella sp. JGM94]MBS0892610.1 gamma-glutamylcyclotransferase [Tatumella sp. JGM130]MBS0900956.1 gamma-glutamylcyclotransferase [Tatumella sp. JGM100]MBS0911890.1 gamma-glutamylcyclotransferase [Tatumella sp. JGM91]